MSAQFTWVPFYQELANALSSWKNRQGELIAFLESLRNQDLKIMPLLDKDENGERFLLKEIDPFTFFAVFNRGIRQEKRIAILDQMKRYFNLESPLPSDFDGIPVVNSQSSWFFAYQCNRAEGDITKLWKVFQLALQQTSLNDKEFIRAFDDALTVKQTNVNLTMGLFWIRPNVFLNLDGRNRNFLKIELPPEGLTAEFYLNTLRSLVTKWKSFPELSYKAWLARKNPLSNDSENKGINYWLVGAYWDGQEPADQTQRFLDHNIWENGYQDRYLDEVKSMRVGDMIAIKAASTQRRGLPFDARNKTVSRNVIKAIGTIVTNRKDGRTVEVEWDQNFSEKSWYFYTNRVTVWHLRTDRDYPFKEYSEKLIDFVWNGKEQDYDWFCTRWFDTDKSQLPLVEEVSAKPYSIDDMINEGVFLNDAELNQYLDRLRVKKAMILQGPPGVGKTFIAQKLAYALMEEVDDKRIEMVQFHQSYSYDDFVRGYRPVPGQAGSFGLQNGVFYEFCQKAFADPERDYVFIIDEINRGNLSQIFGELLMLIEKDKREPKFAVPLLYRHQDEPRFYIPPNLYLVGLMNLADRSLAMVDYALRRRFAFMTLKPQYEGNLFRQWLAQRGMDTSLIQLIVKQMNALNKEIREDPLLGENYQIGHSFFCPEGNGSDFSTLDQSWYQGIVQTEIIPLLKEYWFDNPQKATEAEKKLLA
jgi:5-methylcytosine-specific restriction protein B